MRSKSFAADRLTIFAQSSRGDACSGTYLGCRDANVRVTPASVSSSYIGLILYYARTFEIGHRAARYRSSKWQTLVTAWYSTTYRRSRDAWRTNGSRGDESSASFAIAHFAAHFSLICTRSFSCDHDHRAWYESFQKNANDYNFIIQ